MYKSILITGGAGFIGSNFIYYMQAKYSDYKIICVGCLTYAGNMSTLAETMKMRIFIVTKPIFAIERESIRSLKLKKQKL